MRKCKLIDKSILGIESAKEYAPESALFISSVKYAEDFLWEILNDLLQEIFSSCEEDSWERAQDLDYWTTEELVAYYKENAR